MRAVPRIRRSQSVNPFKFFSLALVLFICTFLIYRMSSKFSYSLHNSTRPVISTDLPKPITFEQKKLTSFSPIKILFAFVAVGNVPERLNQTRDNLRAIGPTAIQGRYRVDCIMFSFANYSNEPDWVHEMERTSKRCQIIRLFKTGYIGFLKSLIPLLLSQAGYEYLAISLDDVSLVPPHGSFNLTRFFDIVHQQGLHVATPAIDNTPHAGLRPTKLKSSNQVRFYPPLRLSHL